MNSTRAVGKGEILAIENELIMLFQNVQKVVRQNKGLYNTRAMDMATVEERRREPIHGQAQ
jgi:hypothetical protein